MAPPTKPNDTTTADLDALESQVLGQPAAPPAPSMSDLDALEAQYLSAPATEPAEPDVLQGGGVLGGVLSRAEAFAGQFTINASDIAANLGVGAASELAGYQGPRAAGPGLDAGLDEQSNFAKGYQQSVDDRAARQEGLGAERYAWGLLGAAAPTLLSGGGTALAGVARAAPAAALDRLSTAVAGRIIGDQVAKTALSKVATTVAGRAAAGALEGGIGAAVDRAGQEAADILAKPAEYVGDVAGAAAQGMLLGGAVGGFFGLGEGVIRAARSAGEAIPIAPPRPVVPAERAITLDDALKEVSTRPIHAAQVPEPQRGIVAKLGDMQQAVTGGEQEAVEAGSRRAREILDRLNEIDNQFDDTAGIAAKRAANQAAAAGEIDLTPTDMLDEVDVAKAAKWSEANKLADDATKSLEAHDLRVKEVQSGLAAAKADYDNALSEYNAAQAARKPAVGAVDDGAVAEARRAVDAAKAELDATTATVPKPKAGAKTKANPEIKAKQSALRKADQELQKLLAVQKTAGKAAQSEAATAAKAAVAQRKQTLAAAEAQFASLTKERDALVRQADEATQALGTVERIGQPRRLTKVEVETRGMFQALKSTIAEYRKGVSELDIPGVSQLASRIDDYERIAYDAARRGDYEGMYNATDQGVKSAIAELLTRRDLSSGTEALGLGLYKIPQQFLENTSIFGKLAEAQKLANPNWSTAIAAAQNSKLRPMFHVGSTQQAGKLKPKMQADSAAVQGLLSQIGEQPAESAEEAIRTWRRAKLADMKTRAEAWGQAPATKDLADETAKLTTQLEDILDNTAMVRRDAAAGRQLLTNLSTLSTAGAAIGAMGGAWLAGQGDGIGPLAAVGTALVSARWLFGSLGKYRGRMDFAIRDAALKIARGGEKASGAAARFAPKPLDQMLSPKERDEAIQEARELQQVGTPAMARLVQEVTPVNAVAQPVAEAMVTHKFAERDYILSKLPQPISTTMFAGSPYQPRAAAQALDRTLNAVKRPVAAIARIAEGKGFKEDMDAVRTLYPSQWQRLQQAIREEIEATKDLPRSPRHRRYIAQVLGEPTTPALERIAEIQRRAQAATAGAEDQGRPQGQGANGADGVTPRAPMRLSMDFNNTAATRADRIAAGQ